MTILKCDRCDRHYCSVKTYELSFLNEVYKFLLCKRCYKLYEHAEVNKEDEALNTDEEREKWYSLSRDKPPPSTRR